MILKSHLSLGQQCCSQMIRHSWPTWPKVPYLAPQTAQMSSCSTGSKCSPGCRANLEQDVTRHMPAQTSAGGAAQAQLIYCCKADQSGTGCPAPSTPHVNAGSYSQQWCLQQAAGPHSGSPAPKAESFKAQHVTPLLWAEYVRMVSPDARSQRRAVQSVEALTRYAASTEKTQSHTHLP